MSRKAIIVFAITNADHGAGVRIFLGLSLATTPATPVVADETASMLTRQLEYTASKAVPDLTSTRVDTSDPRPCGRGL